MLKRREEAAIHHDSHGHCNKRQKVLNLQAKGIECNHLKHWWWWLLLLLYIVVYYPWLTVYALKSYILDFRLSVVCVHIFCFSFGKEKYVKQKSTKSKISSRLLAYTYTCVLCTQIRTYVCRDLVHLDSSGPPGVSSRPLGSHLSTSCVQCVCARAYTHTRIYSHPHSK